MKSSFEEFMGNSLKYLYEEERLATYTSWIYTMEDRCNVKKMAEAGFIFIGNEDEPDSVKCFFCEKHLDGWEATDDPWSEHLNHAPKCLFAKLQKPQDELTLKTFIEIKFSYLKKIKKCYFDELLALQAELSKTLEKKIRQY